ncbi:MAG: hypothetical protein ACXACX_00420 [Candidatus Hodarchaeales archaeon]|jgi:hypothetical protein
MTLEKRKPMEPVVVLIGAIVAFIVGLNINFVSLRVSGFTILGYTGLEIIESLVLFGTSLLITVLAITFYYFGNSRKTVIISRNLTIVGILPGLLGTFLFVIGQHQGRELFIQEVLELFPQLTVEEATQSVNLLSVDFGLAISFAGLVVMGLGAYMLNNSKTIYVGQDKGSLLFPDLSKLELDGNLTTEVLKNLWFCPNDNNKLASNVSRAVPNPEFRVSSERMEENLNNAIAMRKILDDVLPYAKALAEVLLKNSSSPEIELVSTICSVCRKKYVSPKLSSWSSQ